MEDYFFPASGMVVSNIQINYRYLILLFYFFNMTLLLKKVLPSLLWKKLKLFVQIMISLTLITLTYPHIRLTME
jgi:hypothetical protein